MWVVPIDADAEEVVAGLVDGFPLVVLTPAHLLTEAVEYSGVLNQR